MKMVIVGCGRVGSELARRFEAEGNQVAIIDERPAAFTRLPEDFKGEMIVGTGLDEGVLRRAGIEGADAFAAVTNGDNRNIMAAQVASVVFKVPRVITRIYDPIRADFYRTLGMETLCSTAISAGIIHDYITTGINRAAGEESGVKAKAR
ncbi:MAG: TrkA family potassium uptake protein [Candidatus Dormibacteria bacterium]